MASNLNPDKALIFRITHRDNLAWILAHGLFCRNAARIDPGFVQIGNPELIEKRGARFVTIPPGGTLSDYVPFYFTPYSPMMYNINTGYGGIRRRRNEEIAILVTSLRRLHRDGVPFVFTDRHAYLQAAEFSADLADLSRVDWTILQNRDFKCDPNDLGKMERYQAEALVHQHLPVNSLLGIVCYDSKTQGEITAEAERQGVDLKIVAKPSWYF
jgi:ssDNA thymidine ADP-ribosyltransferase, DarT